MKHSVLLGASLALLVACGSTNPFMEVGDGTDAGGDIVSANQLPEIVRGDVHRIIYAPGDGTITIEGIALDESQISSIYTRNAAFDRPGYQAYVAQDDQLDRQSIAFLRQTGNSGAVRGGVVVTGGQFNRVIAGNFVERDGNYTPPSADLVQDGSPDTGLVSYAGTYVGLTNGGPELPVTDPTIPTEIRPNQPRVVTGNVFINADFAQNRINGAITDRTRTLASGGGDLSLPSIALIVTDIAADGTFEGSVEYSIKQAPGTPGDYSGVVDSSIGDYGGILGGPNAEGIGGAVVLKEYDGPNDALGIKGELEWGAFVLDQCGTPANTGGNCTTVDPQ
ncbi:thymidylate synthase [Rhodobacteraceae bacterium D3-12]|nr:thymidylate synthase [Rhodobacteraceae bacterium D3-12]